MDKSTRIGQVVPYFYQTQVNLGSGYPSLTETPCADLTDVTLADEDTKLVLSWYLHQTESHQLSLHKVSQSVTDGRTSGPKDRTPGLPGSDKKSPLYDHFLKPNFAKRLGFFGIFLPAAEEFGFTLDYFVRLTALEETDCGI